MKLSDARIEEFRRICQVELGRYFDADEARAEATNLMQLYELFAQPLPSEIAAHERARMDAEAISDTS